MTWIIILVMHLKFRRKYSPEKQAALSVRAPFAPYLQWMALSLLIAVLITMGLDTEFWNIAIIVGVPWIVLLSLAYVATRRGRGDARAATESPD